jgi:SAM-dependent methyltransferase
MNFDIEKIRGLFPVLHQKVHGKPLVYFDNAATTQKPQSVLDALTGYYNNDNSFDIITMAGSLSYLNLEMFIAQVKRILKPCGKLIMIDSFNHNIINLFCQQILYIYII